MNILIRAGTSGSNLINTSYRALLVKEDYIAERKEGDLRTVGILELEFTISGGQRESEARAFRGNNLLVMRKMSASSMSGPRELKIDRKMD